MAWYVNRIVPLKDDDIKQWVHLIDIIYKEILTPRFQDAKDTVIATAKAIPLAEVVKNPILKNIAPGPDKAGKRRK